jgi:hypothetical protein
MPVTQSYSNFLSWCLCRWPWLPFHLGTVAVVISARHHPGSRPYPRCSLETPFMWFVPAPFRVMAGVLAAPECYRGLEVRER